MYYRDFSFGMNVQMMQILDFNVLPKRMGNPSLPYALNRVVPRAANFISRTPQVVKAGKVFKRKVSTNLLCSRSIRLWKNEDFVYEYFSMCDHCVFGIKVNVISVQISHCLALMSRLGIILGYQLCR
jgi:hypothetical protein